MTDLDPAIWDNETLGDAAHNENLERLEKQQHEDRAARLEGREPREVVIERTHPNWSPPVMPRTGTTPSNYQAVHFADEQQNDIPADSGNYDETAGGVAVESTEEEDSKVSENSATVSDEASDSIEDDSSEESDSTQWA